MGSKRAGIMKTRSGLAPGELAIGSSYRRLLVDSLNDGPEGVAVQCNGSKISNPGYMRGYQVLGGYWQRSGHVRNRERVEPLSRPSVKVGVFFVSGTGGGRE